MSTEEQNKMEQLERKVAYLQSIVDQIDDVLMVHWIPISQDYRLNIAKLISSAIEESNDPAVSLGAKQRMDADRSRNESLQKASEAINYWFEKYHDLKAEIEESRKKG